jgi:hypothetical protein
LSAPFALVLISRQDGLMFERDGFKALIQAAISRPENADVWLLWDAMVASVQEQEPRMQLNMAGEGFLDIAKVMERRAAVFLVRPQLGAAQEPIMPEDAFSPFVRHFMDIDFSSLVEGVARKEHDYPDSRVVFSGDVSGELDLWLEGAEGVSTIGEGDVEALEHDEDVMAWADLIRAWVRQQGRTVSISDVMKATHLSASRIWIAALLNHFEFELKNDFYSCDRLILSVDSVDQDLVT